MKKTLIAFAACCSAQLWATDYEWNPSTTEGRWNDAANWLVAGAPADGYPQTAADKAHFAGVSATITVSANVTLGGMTIDTSGSSVWRFEGDGDRALACTPEVTGDGTGSVVFKRVSTGSTATRKSGALTVSSAPKSLAFDRNCGWRFSGAILPNTRVTLLRHGALFNDWKPSVFGDLAIYGENYAYGYEMIEFGSFIDMGGVACLEVNSGKVKFRDTRGIVKIGGTQTLEDAGPQIPVAPQFAIAAASTDSAYLGLNLALPLGACTVDAEGVVREIPVSTMKTSFAGATELDNIYIAEATTLTEDMTVNAVVYGAALDLGGHTLTIRSGVLRPAQKNLSDGVSNGKVVTCAPMILPDGVNNGDERMSCDFATAGNNDVEQAMLSFAGIAGSMPKQASYAEFVGALYHPNSRAPLFEKSLTARNVFREIADGEVLDFSSHYWKLYGAGIGGNGRVTDDKFCPAVWLGDHAEGEEPDRYCFVVGANGLIVPGSVAEDGFRRGRLGICYRTSNIKGFENVTFKSGAKLKVVLRPDETATWLDCSEYGSFGEFHYPAVTLAGALEIAEAARCPGEMSWTVLKSGRQTEGAFETVTPGYSVAYNQKLGEDANGYMIYGVVVTKDPQPEADNTIVLEEDDVSYDSEQKSVTLSGRVAKAGDEAAYVRLSVAWGETEALGEKVVLEGVYAAGDAYRVTFTNQVPAQVFHWRLDAVSDLEVTREGEIRAFRIPVALVENEPTFNRGLGAIVLGGTVDAAVTVTLEYGSTKDLGQTLAIGSVLAGASFTASIDGYKPADTVYCRFCLVDAAGVKQVTETRQVVMPASGEIGAISATAENTQITISGEIADLGLGDVTIRYSCGTSKGNLVPVGTQEITKTGTYSFSVSIGREGTFYYAVEVVSAYQGQTWTVQKVGDEPIALTDKAVYAWKGGVGRWDDAASWTTADCGGIGLPNANSEVVIAPEVDSVVELSKTRMVHKLTLSTARAAVTLRGATLCADNVYMASAGQAKPLTLERCVLGTKNAATRLKQVEAVDSLSAVRLGESSGLCLGGAVPNADVTLFGEDWLHSGVEQENAGRLTVARGFSKLTGTWRFASFAQAGKVGVAGVENGKVSFAETSGIREVNGIAPDFAIVNSNDGWANNRYGWGICRVDAKGVILQVSAEEMHRGLAGAGTTDTVYLAENTTLDVDLTVNALALAAGVKLDLGGHTLTVVSGVVRPQANNAPYEIENGTIAVLAPFMTFDSANNGNPRFKAKIVYGGPGEGELAFTAQGGSCPSAAQLTEFSGTVYAQGDWSPASAETPSFGQDLELGVGKRLTVSGHNQTALVRGIGGAFVVDQSMMRPVYWIGLTNGTENLRERECRVVVAPGGRLSLGSWAMDGFRRGQTRIEPAKDNLYRTRTFEMLGGTLEATIFADGTATCLDLTGATTDLPTGIATTLGGDLSLTLGPRVRSGVWTIIRTQSPTKGFFSNAGERGRGLPGFRVSYNVKQADGTYAVEVTKTRSGLTFFIR